MSAWYRMIKTGKVMRQAFQEQQGCIHDIYDRLEPYLYTPEDTPAVYTVKPDAIPESYYSWRKNLFSTLFHSAYLLLDCPEPRRKLYGRLIHLYRIWVTSADNLLDDEDKVVIPIVMPGSSRVMRQVVALMAADRVLSDILREAVDDGVINQSIADSLQRESLCRLLPSAAEEAAEEGGIKSRPSPEHVLEVIHRLKTGLLFNIAFAGPEIAEPYLPPNRLDAIKSAMMQFGLGCQLLDDVRDLSKDLQERRHNYLLSWLEHHQPDTLQSLAARAEAGADRLYLQTPRQSAMVIDKGIRMMHDGLVQLGNQGLGVGGSEANRMARFMLNVLDLKELSHAV